MWLIHAHNCLEYNIFIIQVPLGVILKSENKTDEMCEIMECVQQYVPHVQASHNFVNPITEDVMKIEGDHLYHILFGGDQLTVARARGSQRDRINSDNGLSKFDGLIPIVEDWHAKLSYYR